jgi:hypothetical protein
MMGLQCFLSHSSDYVKYRLLHCKIILYTASLSVSSTSVDFIEADDKLTHMVLHGSLFVDYLTTLAVSKYKKHRTKR